MFWEDFWSGIRPLKDEFPRLYALSSLKFSTIQNFKSAWSSSNGHWVGIWSRPLRAWEEAAAQSLGYYAEQSDPSLNKDRLVWVHNNQVFTSKECYSSLISSANPPKIWTLIWGIKVPPKVQVFLWKLEHKVLPTNSFLGSRLHLAELESTCKWCGCQDESIDHLFLNCELVNWSWSFLKYWCDPSFSQGSSSLVLENLLSHNCNSFSNKVWQIMIVVVLWSIWLGRNEFVFQGKKLKKKVCHRLLLHRSFKWLEAGGLFNIKFSNFWEVNPSGALRLSLIERKSDFWHKIFLNFDLVCPADGSIIQKDNDVKAGIGGMVWDNLGTLKYIFSGPVHVESVLESEVKALEHLLTAVQSV